MNQLFSTHHTVNGWWVFNDQRIYCWNASEADALATVAETFGPEFDLSNEVDAATFKTTVSAGTQTTLASVDAAIAERDESDATERLRALLKLTFNAASALTAEIARENDLFAEQVAIAKQQEATRVEMFRQQEAQRQAAEKVEAEREAQYLATKREQLRQSKKLERFHDGSHKLIEVATKRVLRSFKPGEPIPQELLKYAQ